MAPIGKQRSFSQGGPFLVLLVVTLLVCAFVVLDGLTLLAGPGQTHSPRRGLLEERLQLQGQLQGEQQVQQRSQEEGQAQPHLPQLLVTQPDAPLRVFVGVLSASTNRLARDAIRATWGSHPGLYNLRFILLQPRNESVLNEVRREAVEKGDLVVVPSVLDHYNNQSHQTLEICRVASADARVTHVVKVDDDSYPRWDVLLPELAQLPRGRLYWGHMSNNSKPQRKKSKKWYVSEEEWPRDRYYKYAQGVGYVLSVDLARAVAAGAAMKVASPYFRLEDICMGSWLDWVEWESGPILRISDERFNFFTSKYCTDSDLISHKITPDLHRMMWAAGGRCSH